MIENVAPRKAMLYSLACISSISAVQVETRLKMGRKTDRISIAVSQSMDAGGGPEGTGFECNITTPKIFTHYNRLSLTQLAKECFKKHIRS